MRVPLGTVVREWGRIGLIGFGGPPAHVALLRELTVERRGWIEAREFEDANAACQLLPGPGSTQMAIYTAQRVAGLPGAFAGGLAFILPGLLIVLAIAAVALGEAPPAWIVGVGAGAGAAVIAVVAQAGLALGRSSLAGRRDVRAPLYLAAGFAAVVLAGALVVLVLVAAGLLELAWRRRGRAALHAWPVALAQAATLTGLAWTAFKVGALSFGGGFVIIPLMQEDAVDRHGWMTEAEFLNAVAFGQLTPGPVTHTVALVGWAASGLGGALLASAIAFAPSFLAVGLGGARFARLRGNADARAFLDGAGPAAVGAILGAAVPLVAALASGGRARCSPLAALLLAARPRAAVAARGRRAGGPRRGARRRPAAVMRLPSPAMDLQAEATDVLSRLIRFDTVNPPGAERACQEWLKAYLEDAGLECELHTPDEAPDRPNLVARLRGDADGPVLGYLSHVDTVLADAGDWQHDPWSGAVHDGVIWGRGAIDMKSQTAAEAVALAHLARQGWRPPRGEVKLISVVDEETGGRLGAQWLTEQRPDVARVDWLLNEGAGAVMPYGDRRLYGVCCAEKGTFRFRVRARGRAGHASVPALADNALLKLLPALAADRLHPRGVRRRRGAARVPARDRRGPGRPRRRRRPDARRRAAARRDARADARRDVRADADLGGREDQRDPGARRVRRRLPAPARARQRGRGAPRARAARRHRTGWSSTGPRPWSATARRSRRR